MCGKVWNVVFCDLCGTCFDVFEDHFEDHVGFELDICGGCHWRLHQDIDESGRLFLGPAKPWPGGSLEKFCEMVWDAAHRQLHREMLSS